LRNWLLSAFWLALNTARLQLQNADAIMSAVFCGHVILRLPLLYPSCVGVITSEVEHFPGQVKVELLVAWKNHHQSQCVHS
jgi:hypothetical protein